MTTSNSSYTGNGSQTIYTVTFPYISQSHVFVSVNGVPKTVTTDYTWLNATQIQFVVAPPNGQGILFQRSTSATTRLVTFQDASVLNGATQNLDSLQMFYLTQEVVDYVQTVVSVAGNVPAPAGGDVGKFIKATGVGTFAWNGLTTSASQTTNTPAGNIVATDVQGAINELDTEKAPTASPTFTGTVTTATISAAGNISTTGTLAATGGVTAASLPAASLPFIPATINEYRLTGVTLTPVMTADSTTLSTIYMTPYKGDHLSLFSGGVWRMFQPGETSLAVTGRTTDLPFDIFAFDNAGTVTLEFLNWTSATARATTLTRVNGVWTKTGDQTRRYLGSCRPRSATAFHWVRAGTDLPCKFDLFNADNRVLSNFKLIVTTDTWNYTLAAWRQVQASANYQVELMVGLQEEVVNIGTHAAGTNTVSNTSFSTGVGAIDSTSAVDGLLGLLSSGAAINTSARATLVTQPVVGRHFYAWMEYSAATGLTTWYGDGAVSFIQNGLTGTWTC